MDTIFGTTSSTTFIGSDSSVNHILLSARDWVGQHSFAIRTTVGTSASKLYSTNYADSTAFTITVENPCETTSFNLIKSPRTYTAQADRRFSNYNGVWSETTAASTTTIPKSSSGKTVVEARELGGEVIFQYEMPQDSASVSYGSNIGVDEYSLCGERHHYMMLGTRTI